MAYVDPLSKEPIVTSPKPASTPTPTPASAPAPSPSPAATIPTDKDLADLSELLSALTPAEMERLRGLTQSTPELAKMLSPTRDGNIVKLADGSYECRIILSPDVISMIEPWAEAAGKTIGEQIQETSEMAISSFLSCDWGSIQAQPVVPPVVPPVAGK